MHTHTRTHLILGVLESPTGDKQLDNPFVPMSTGNVETSITISVLSIEEVTGAVSIEERCHQIHIAPVTGIVECSFVLLRGGESNTLIHHTSPCLSIVGVCTYPSSIGQDRVSSTVTQQSHHHNVTLSAGYVQSHVAKLWGVTWYP